MYHDQIRHEQRLITQGWVEIVRDVSRFLNRAADMFAGSKQPTPTTFTPHRVPGTDKLR